MTDIEWLMQVDPATLPTPPFKIPIGENHNGKNCYITVNHWRLYIHWMRCEVWAEDETPRQRTGAFATDVKRLRDAVENHAESVADVELGEFAF